MSIQFKSAQSSITGKTSLKVEGVRGTTYITVTNEGTGSNAQVALTAAEARTLATAISEYSKAK